MTDVQVGQHQHVEAPEGSAGDQAEERSDTELPRWAREVETLLPACSHFLLHGNIHDVYFLPTALASSEPRSQAHAQDQGPPPAVLAAVPRMLAAVLTRQGVSAVLTFAIGEGPALAVGADRDSVISALQDSAIAAPGQSGGAESSRLTSVLHAAAAHLQGTTDATDHPRGARSSPDWGDLGTLADLICGVSESSVPIALIVEDSSRLVRDMARLTEEEYDFWRRIDRTSRRSRPGRNGMYNPVVWLAEYERDVPGWFVVGNDSLRTVVLALPDTSDRENLARRHIALLAGKKPPVLLESDLEPHVRTLAGQTAGMRLSAMVRIFQIARQQATRQLCSRPEELVDAATSYRVGAVENQWSKDHIVDHLKVELRAIEDSGNTAQHSSVGRDPILSKRVLGQRSAVKKALEILARSTAGLTAAQSAPSALRPRGVLLFAGPTGVGKTELAKGLSELIFGDERMLIRFDMSEFSEPHAAERLIGAPPGFIGHEAGGELTNAIRRQPFSVVLFDEFEKAHQQLLDKFLQVLDDGRLTDGRGDTVFFTETLLIFTTNLGSYQDVADEDDDCKPVLVRRPLIEPSMSFAERTKRVRKAVRDHFIEELGRPELLNRIGEHNIVVFDYIGRNIGEEILDQMLDRIKHRLAREHRVTLEIEHEARERLAEACLDDTTLEFGGRGIGSRLETVLVNPLSKRIVLDRPAGGAIWHLEGVREEEEKDQWTIQLAAV